VKTTDRGKDHEEISREGGERGPELGMRGGLTRAEAQRKTTVENEEKRKVGIENKGEVKVENKMSSKVEGKLRGRILVKPKEQMWMLQRVKAGEGWKYTCEPGHVQWSPMNSNLHMQGIKVKVDTPVPAKTHRKSACSIEDTLLLLDLIREKARMETRIEKEEKIRILALQQKQKKGERATALCLKI